MKKKELLIIFILAGLMTGGTPFLFQCKFIWKAYYVMPSLSKCGFNLGLILPDYLSIGGFPLPFWGTRLPFYGIGMIFLLIDLLFWFLVLAAGWWMTKKLNKSPNLKNNLPVKLLILLLIVTSVIGGAVVWQRKNLLIPSAIPTPTPYKTYPSILNFNFYPIHEIKEQRLGPGSYNTEGYVVKIFTCPPCPSGALCKPCMGENIVISEESKILTDYSSLRDIELIIFTQNPKQFQLGKKYQFSIQIMKNKKNKKTTFEPINDVELVGYQEAVEESCHELESQIVTLLDQANYCQKDADCRVAGTIPVGCPFDCYRLINKEAGLTNLERVVETYFKNCSPECFVQIQCAPPPTSSEIRCQNNKCVNIRFVTK